MTSTRRGALCATVLLATVFLSGNLLPVSIGEGGVKTSSRVSLVADAAKFVHDIGDDFDPEEFDGIEEMMDEEDDEEFEYTPPPTARSPPKKKTKKKKKTPAKKKVVVEENEDDEFGDDDWAVGDDGDDDAKDGADDEEEDDDEFGEYDREEQAKKKRSPKGRKSSKGGKDGSGASSGGGKRARGPRVRVRKQKDFSFEYFAGAFFFLYFINYFYGSAVNARQALAWIKAFRTVYENEFHVVGTSGENVSVPNASDLIVKESQAEYSLFATGRANCRAVVTELKLRARQDLVATLQEFATPTEDLLVLTAVMNEANMHPFILAVMDAKAVKAARKEEPDLKDFGPKKRKVNGMPDSLVALSDNVELVGTLLTTAVCQQLTKHLDCFHSLHFTDQYEGSVIGVAEPTQKVLRFKFKIRPDKDPNMDSIKALTKMAIRFIDLVGERARLTSTGKAKAEKARAQRKAQRAAKETQEAREEAFQRRRDEKFKEEQERYKKMTPKEQEKYDEKQKKKEIKRAMRQRTRVVR
jgi:hypothetical protein